MSRIITVTKGVGIGQTALSAFDRALLDACIADHNLIYLSSVIPADSEIIVSKYSGGKIENYGNRLYVVIAEKRENEIGKTACAGVGWVQASDGSGRGLFVEHVGVNEEEVVSLIKKSLSDMTKSRLGDFGPIKYEVSSIRCVDMPVCALVSAVYQTEKW